MKKLSILLVALIFILASCSKGSGSNGLSQDIQNIIPDSLVKKLEAKGMVINRGNTPPTLEGIFLVSPFKLISNYGPTDNYPVGKVIEDYLLHLYNQQGVKANIDNKSRNGTDVATGLGSFISGSGNKFTLFAKISGKESGVDYTKALVISGDKSATGINNLQYALVMTSKNEPSGSGALMPVGAIRIYQDDDKVSPSQPAYQFAINAGSHQIGASAGVPAK